MGLLLNRDRERYKDFQQETRGIKDGDTPIWRNCTADEAFA
jgi:hypothetical protein